MSANIYCDRHINELLRQVIQPLREELRSVGAMPTLLWFMRYARCGQHLKLRIHTGDESGWPALQNRLTDLAESFFATLPPLTEEETPRISSLKLPPIDKEDELDGDYPDRSILWTNFQPSPRTVGSEKYVMDDLFLGHFYSCMDANAGLVLEEVLRSDVDPSLKSRQSQLLRTVVPCLVALDLSLREQLDYVSFHRDWLLRYLLTQSPPQTKAEDTIERLNQKLHGMESTVEALGSIIASHISQTMESGFMDDNLAALRKALRDFFAHVREFRGRAEYDLDPYTSDASFLPLFKVFHGFANQIGVPILNEFYTYQLLLRGVERSHVISTTVAEKSNSDE